MSRKTIGLLILLIFGACGGILFFHWFTARGAINPRACDRIQIGMSEREVEEILGDQRIASIIHGIFVRLYDRLRVQRLSGKKRGRNNCGRFSFILMRRAEYAEKGGWRPISTTHQRVSCFPSEDSCSGKRVPASGDHSITGLNRIDW
jgi:hypothetical protein